MNPNLVFQAVGLLALKPNWNRIGGAAPSARALFGTLWLAATIEERTGCQPAAIEAGDGGDGYGAAYATYSLHHNSAGAAYVKLGFSNECADQWAETGVYGSVGKMIPADTLWQCIDAVKALYA